MTPFVTLFFQSTKSYNLLQKAGSSPTQLAKSRSRVVRVPASPEGAVSPLQRRLRSQELLFFLRLYTVPSGCESGDEQMSPDTAFRTPQFQETSEGSFSAVSMPILGSRIFWVSRSCFWAAANPSQIMENQQTLRNQSSPNPTRSRTSRVVGITLGLNSLPDSYCRVEVNSVLDSYQVSHSKTDQIKRSEMLSQRSH